MIATAVAEIDSLRAQLSRAYSSLAAFAYLLEGTTADLVATQKKLDQTIVDLARMTARAYWQQSR